MINIILCGGSGTRLWPLSRKLMPKQFIKLFNNQSLFQLTAKRNHKLCHKQLVVTNKELYFLAIDQLAEINLTNNKYLLEPVGRNTAPAIALSCLMLDKDDIVLITPSDHLIKNIKNYQQAIKKAQQLAKNDNLVTFGIKPDSAQTNFGYIQVNNFDVKKFHEKPNLENAKKYLKDGNYYWNSGMFCFKVGIFLQELEKYSPEIYHQSIIAINHLKKQDNISRIEIDYMQNIPDNSIDYAVMEKSKIIKIVPLDADWSDVGNFETLSKELPNDKDNNLIITDKLVKTIGIKDSIIIDTTDVLLVSKKNKIKEIKNLVNALKLKNSTLTENGLIGYRPWGKYTILGKDNGYKIKKIEVKPGARLSLQTHKYRNEHWVVVKGEAVVTNADKILILKENESIYIKAGTKHRLENKIKQHLIIIEVQVGSYTGEDDIQRFDDDYQRG